MLRHVGYGMRVSQDLADRFHKNHFPPLLASGIKLIRYQTIKYILPVTNFEGWSYFQYESLGPFTLKR